MAEQDFQKTEWPVTSVGSRLANARKAAGLSRSDLAGRTKIAERYLASIEEGRFSDLASRAYAVGFSRAYARVVGLDENEIVQAVREELAASESDGQGLKPAAFEPGDPARVPGLSLAGVAALGALLVVVLVFVFWRSYYIPAVSLPDLIPEEAARPPVAAVTPVPAAPQVPAADAPVVFTALAPDVWVKFYDAAGKQLVQKQMALGESYTVPADAQGPRIWTGRPDALQITIGGKPVPPLADRQMTIKDMPVSAAALLARKPGDAAAAVIVSPKLSASLAPPVAAAKAATAARTARPSPASSLAPSSALAQSPSPSQGGPVPAAGEVTEASTVSD